MKVRKWPVVGVLLAALWLFVRGVPLAPMAIIGEFLIGLAVGLPIAFSVRRLYLSQVDVGRGVRVLPTATLYVVLFLKDVVVANVDVAYRVLHPSLPIEPDVVELPLRVQNDAAVTTIANSITLTPGTLTMDHDEESNTLYVHGILGRRRAATVAPIRRWENLLLVIFDEEARPGDEPPSPPSGDRPAVDAHTEGRDADGATIRRETDSAVGPGGDEDGR